MINNITKIEYPNIWEYIIDDVFECSFEEHRRGPTFFKRFIYKIDEEYFPNHPELWGYWESRTITWSDDYGSDDVIDDLIRVEKVKKIIETFEWKPVKE